MRIPICHPESKYQGRGMCVRCYQIWHYKNNKEKYDSRARTWQANNIERVKESNRRNNRKDPERYLYRTAKVRAKKYELDFNLDITDVHIPQICPVLGIPLIPFSGKFAHNSPSIDRIDNSKGYVKGNVIVVSFRANSLKKDATVAELVKLSTFYANLNGENE